jgi:cytochrome c oxidase assembly factor CtaG
MRVVRLIPLLLLLPGHAAAHGADGSPASYPWVALPLLLAAGGCLLGWRRWPAWHGPAFLAGICALALATLPPLATWRDGSFLLHMIEHELIMVIAAPLLVLARPLGPWLRVLPRTARRRIGRILAAAPSRWLRRTTAAPAMASILQGVVLWAWHVPPVFGAALRDPVLHTAQHLSFLVGAWLFWRAMLGHGRHRHGAAVLHLFLASAQGGLLGALFLFAPRPWLPHEASGAPFGLSPLEDQQLAGLVMAGVACLAYPATALGLLARWIRGRRREATDAFVIA